MEKPFCIKNATHFIPNPCSLSGIEDNYDGPALEDGKVTAQFMIDLMEHFKAQKKLHKKYAYKVMNTFSVL